MSNYYVLTPPGATDPEKQTLFIRDGFSWFAFILPLPWLLFRRLWLLAGLSIVLFLLAVIAAEYLGLDGLPVAYAFILCLWTGLEGGHVRAQWLIGRGWDLKANITANDLEEAETAYFADLPATAIAAPGRGFSGGSGPHPSNSVALGLIGPYGSR